MLVNVRVLGVNVVVRICNDNDIGSNNNKR